MRKQRINKMIHWRHIFRNYQNNPFFSLVFIFCIGLGLCGFISLDLFQKSLQNHLSSEAKNILGADISLSSRRKLQPDEVNVLEKHLRQKYSSFEKSEVTQLYSMIQSSPKIKESIRQDSNYLSPKTYTKLTLIKAIDSTFPLYGHLQVAPKSSIFTKNSSSKISDFYSNKNNPTSNSVWIDPGLMNSLHLEIGSSIKIGEKIFTVSGVVQSDSSEGLQFNFAPVLYMNRDALPSTHLLSTGSLAEYSVLYKINHFSEDKNFIQKIKNEIKNTDIKILTAKNVNLQMQRISSSLSDFLNLTSLCALFLSALASIFLLRFYLQTNIYNLAILKSLGMTPFNVFTSTSLYILSLGALGGVLSLIGSHWVAYWVAKSLTGLLPLSFHFVTSQESLESFFIALIIASIGSFLFCFPFLFQVSQIEPSCLLREKENLNLPLKWKNSWLFTPSVALFLSLTLWKTQSMKTGIIFFSSLLILVPMFSWGPYGVSYLLFHGVSKFKKLIKQKVYEKPNSLFQYWFEKKILLWFWALRDIVRLKSFSIIIFTSLGMALSILNLVFQVHSNFQKQLTPHSQRPQLFLFDIQEDQVEPLKIILKKYNLALDRLSPMIRSRLTHINGRPYEKKILTESSPEHSSSINESSDNGASDESTSDENFRRRGFNLSIRDQLGPDEKIVDGKSFSEIKKENVSLISLEQNFANRFHLKINDTLRFDIEGIPIEGKVVNLRQVQWTSFQPNFFIEFNHGLIDEAPKTFIASLSGLDAHQKENIQNKVIHQLPNITFIDVDKMTHQFSNLFNQLANALKIIAFFSLIIAALTLFTIIVFQTLERKKEIYLLKVMGTSFRKIQNMLLIQFTLTSFISSLFGTFLGIFIGYILHIQVFKNEFYLFLKTPFILITGIVFVTYWVSRLLLLKLLG